MITPRFFVAGALAAAATLGVASAQGLPEGRVYAFHSGPTGSCPGLDWHIVASGTNLQGMIAWNNMKSMAQATGTLNPTARTFSMTAKEVGGQGRSANVTGTVRADGWLIADITAPNLSCKGITVQWYPMTPAGGNG
jgi:hypothetical protein